MPFVSREGVRLYYASAGQGPTVLFHTGGCGDGRMWEWAGYTATITGCRRVLLDHRGHGRSDSPTTVEGHMMGEYVADVVAVLDHLGVQRAALVGYSGGAATAYAVAADHPDRVSGVVGLGGVGSPGTDFSELADLAVDVRDRGTRAAIEAMAAIESEPCPPWLVDHLATTSTEMFALLLEGHSRAEGEWAWLPRIQAPTLIIAGSEEDEFGETAQAAAAVPDGEAVLLPGLGHLQAFWHAEKTAPIIRDFLAEHGLLTGTGGRNPTPQPSP
jgi:pimeloyl-ACP methyl ester carboxylesterase